MGLATAAMLDVGQGQCVLLRVGSRTALVDCGGSSLDNAGDRAADWLADRGIQTLDLLILTHFHTDHAGGVPELFQRIPISVLAVPQGDDGTPLQSEILALAAEHSTQVVSVQDDRTLPFGPGLLRLYAPLGAGETNEEGLSVLCSVGQWDMLLTGDMDGTVEQRLIKYGNLPDLEVLVAGHHGSDSSTSEELLAATRPEQVLISVGYNTYGHPSAEMLRRAAAYGAEIYRTDLMGDITVTVGNG
jgi:competence protein ComEC